MSPISFPRPRQRRPRDRLPVDADAFARGGRHTVLECPDVVLVEPVGLVVPPRLQVRLLAEARELVDRVVQLAVGVSHLVLRDEQLEPIDEQWVVPLALGERGELGREVDDERRLDQCRLNQGLERLLPEFRRGSLVVNDAARGRRPRDSCDVRLGRHAEPEGLGQAVEER
jgi:hypothetical protein